MPDGGGEANNVPVVRAPMAQRPGLRGRWDRFLAWKLPGLPPGLGTIQWLFSTSLRMPAASVTALIIAWTGVVISLWVAAFTAIGSIVVTAFGVTFSGHFLGVSQFTSNSSGGVVFLSAIAAGVVGFGTGFAASYTDTFFGASSIVAASLATGIIIGLVFAFVSTAMEWKMLDMRGYRRPSEREWNLYLTNAMQTVVDNMELRETPRILVMDSAIPQAWTYSRSIVISKGLMEGLDSGELAGVLAHEMTHWRRGDGLALRMVWSFGWPVAVLFSLGMFLSGNRYGITAMDGAGAGAPHASGKGIVKGSTSFLGFLGWLFLWPAWLLTRILTAVTVHEGRVCEYEADAGAAEAGLEGGLKRALDKLSAFEMGRNAWDAAFTTTHPPTELRVEALEEGLDLSGSVPPPGPIDEMNGKRVSWLFGILVILIAIAVSPHIPAWHHQHESWWW
jgi:Zn-dependent protease with chaperone function